MNFRATRMNFRARPPQSTEVFPWLLVALLTAFLIGMLSACANFNGSLKAGYQSADNYTNQVRAELQADIITADDAQKQLNYILQAKALLDTANAQNKACQAQATSGTAACNNGQVALDSANAILAQVSAWIITQQAAKKGATK